MTNTNDVNPYGIPPELLALNISSTIVKKLNILVIGEMGTGKTQFSVTGPKPVYHYCLDRAGSDGLARFDKEGWLVRDTRFANDDPFAPTQWLRFEQDIKQKINAKVFNAFGTIVIDGLTGMSTHAMNALLAERNRAGGTPSGAGYGESDYSVSQTRVRNLLQKILTVPCTVVVTAHSDTFKEEATGKVRTGVALTGQLKRDIPAMFAEVYYTSPMLTSKGMQWNIVTQYDGTFNARSSNGAGGKLATNEPADLMQLITKIGMQIPKAVPKDFYLNLPPTTNVLTDVTAIKKV